MLHLGCAFESLVKKGCALQTELAGRFGDHRGRPPPSKEVNHKGLGWSCLCVLGRPGTVVWHRSEPNGAAFLDP